MWVIMEMQTGCARKKQNHYNGRSIMFDQTDFGKRVREFRTRNKFSQKEIALRIGVSEQAVSKWENGDCLPDVYNLTLLAQILRVPVDVLLDTEFRNSEKVVETITVGGACFEIVEKPETILAGKNIPAHGFEMAQNGAQELEVFDTFEYKFGYAYMPIIRK